MRKSLDRALWREALGAELGAAEHEVVDRLIDVAKSVGITLTRVEAGLFWSWHSRRVDASWLRHEGHADEQIVEALRDFAALGAQGTGD